MQLFEAAAIKGYPEAQYMVGYLMQSGDLGAPRPSARLYGRSWPLREVSS